MPAPETNRLFFALWPDEATRSACALAARELKLRMQPGGYLIQPERLHLTLLFLGDFVSRQKESAAIDAASRLRASPFTLRLEQAGAFGNREGVWWLAPRETPPQLTKLYEQLRERLREAAVPVDRVKFVPHLSVVRIAGKPLATTMIQAVNWPVTEFVLIRSLLNRQAEEYQIIGRWPLAGEIAAALPPGQLKLWENQ
jgi:2'-5' RNA ligase